METTIRIKNKDLNSDFLEKIKALFKNEEELEISISPVTDFGLTLKETKEEYITRVNGSIEKLEKKDDIVSLSDDEFENLTNDLIDSK